MRGLFCLLTIIDQRLLPVDDMERYIHKYAYNWLVVTSNIGLFVKAG